MKHEELLEYSTVIQLLRMQNAGQRDCLLNVKNLLLQSDFSPATIVALIDKQLKAAKIRQIDFEDVQPDAEGEK